MTTCFRTKNSHISHTIGSLMLFSPLPTTDALLGKPCLNVRQPNPGSSAIGATVNRLRRFRIGPAALSLSLIAIVFGIDLCLPLGVASAVPYAFAVLLALKAKPRWFAPAMAALCGILTIAKMGIVPERGSTEMWYVITNRCLAIFAICMTTLLGMLRRKAEAERERSEKLLREHQSALVHLGRLSLLGQVTAGLAHELNQPLAAVCLQSELATRYLEQSPTARPELALALAEIRTQSTRAAEIVRSIRRLAKGSPPRCAAVDLVATIQNVLRLLDWQARRTLVQVSLETDIKQLIVFADRIQVEQVLANLVQNSIDALSEVSGSRAILISLNKTEDAATIRVHDTGPGIDNSLSLFEPFATTKPEGLGLGLAISRNIAEAHGGQLWSEPHAKGGSMFAFTLPLERQESA